MSGKYALIIGNTEYTDPGLAQLTAPGKDADDFARVLKDKEIGAFDSVNVLVNESSASVVEAIDEFFDQKRPDDMLVLYFSGHGIKDEIGSLYLAFKNTIRSRLRSTAIKSDYIREAMDQSRSKRQVLILDCCNSGAFPQGTKAELGGSMGMTTAFQGYGRFVLTASDATQFAWEGDKVIGETDNSLFTHFLVKGLEGEADNDGDGRITVDELYDYVYDQISGVTPKQTPTKSASKVEGEIVLRQSTRIESIKPVPLPTPLLDSIENPFADIRLGAVQQLTRLLNGKNLGLARSAREALEGIAEKDDSRQVSEAATKALVPVRQAGQMTTQKEAEETQLPAAQKEAPSKLETDEATPLSSRQALITLGWAIAGAVGGVVYDAFGTIGAAIGGAIGGLITAIALRNENPRSNQKRMVWFTLAWTIGGAVGWTIGEVLTEAIGMGIGFAIGAIISMAIIVSTGYVFSNWKGMAWIVLGWTIGAGIGWAIAKGFLIENLSIDYATSWAIGTGIGWAIGGYVLGWQLLNNKGK